MCERTNRRCQNTESRAEPDHRGAGGRAEGQRGGQRSHHHYTNTALHRPECVCSPQELEELKEEVEKASQLQTQRDSLSQKLQVTIHSS